MIAGVVRGEESAGLRRIPGDRVEIDHAVVGVAGPDPLIDRLAFGLAFPGKASAALVGRQRRAEIFTPLVRARSIICLWIAMMSSAVGVGFCLRVADVVDAFQHDDVRHAALAERVALESRQRVDARIEVPSLSTRLPPMPALSTAIFDVARLCHQALGETDPANACSCPASKRLHR